MMETAPALPVEMVEQVLLRLPAKSLFRFRCVSKQWLCLISDPKFRALYRHRSSRKSMLLVSSFSMDIFYDSEPPIYNFKCIDVRNERVVSDSSFTFLTEDRLDIIHPNSYQGLLMFLGSDTMLLCNPSTQQIAHLPFLSEFYSNRFGIAYLQPKDEYKVVGLEFWGHYGAQLVILTVSGEGVVGSWKAIRPGFDWKSFPVGPFLGFSFPASVDGVMYWFVHDRKTQVIVSFDLEKEEFCTLNCPRPQCLAPEMVCLKEFCGCLCLVESFSIEETQKQILDIWMLKGKGEHSWVKEYSIDLSSLEMSDCKPHYHPASVILVDGCGGKILVQVHCTNHLFEYDINKKCFRRLEGLDMEVEFPKICTYFENLFSFQ